MIVEIDDRSPVPPYEQLRRQIVTVITSGGLAVGERLPTIRQLAQDLGVAPGTVQRSYRELEQAGLIESRGRRGTTVAPRDRWHAALDVEHVLGEAAARYATVVRQLGVTEADAVSALHTHLADPVRS